MHAKLRKEGWSIGRDQTARLMKLAGVRGVSRSKKIYTTKSRHGDVFSRKIVGWNVASTLKADVLPMQALEMVAWQLGGDLQGAIHHADHGSNYMSTVYTSHVEELGAVPSTGTVGDSRG